MLPEVLLSVTYNFDGHVTLVPGAASGMGFDTPRAFARAGAAVTLADLSEEARDRAVEELGKGEEIADAVLWLCTLARPS